MTRTFRTWIFICLTAITCSVACAADQAIPAGRTLNVIVVIGGHAFDTKEFPKVFEGYDDIKYTMSNPKDDSEVFEDISGWKYDVIVFYNMGKKISEKRQANFLALLDKGVGVVATHHCIAAYPGWPQWAKIIGGKYFEKASEFEGKQYRASTYKDDVDHKVFVADPTHPITLGIKDFPINDETYKFQWVDPQAKLLLSTDDPTSDKELAWAKTYRNSKVCYIQLGHGPAAYHDANYRKIIAQAIRWAAK